MSHMTDAQLGEEVGFWERVLRHGGQLQQQMAATMLREVMTPVDEVRQSYKILDTIPASLGSYLELTTREALAGLALSHFLRRTLDEELLQMRTGTAGVGVDIVFGVPDRPVALVHERHERLGRFVPPLREDVKFTWYEDEVLVVRGHTPATPTLDFRERFLGAADGFFDSDAYVTLRPQLKAAYVGL